MYRHAHGTSFKKGQRGKGKCKSPSFPIFHSLGSLPLEESIVPRFLGILSLCIDGCICVYRWLPTYDVSTYSFFSLWWCKSDLHSVETVLWIWVFDLFPGTCSSHSATWSWGETTNTLTIILSPRAIVFHFQYSIKQITFNCVLASAAHILNKLPSTEVWYSTRYYRIGFVFDDFALL